MKELLVSFQESLEKLISANKRIREVEKIILEITKGDEHENQDSSLVITQLIDEVQEMIDDVELRANRLDVQISAIERLTYSHE